MKIRHAILIVALAVCAPCSSFSQSADTAFEKAADDFINGYLAARPIEAVNLGFHEYDGKFADYSRASIAGEVARLKKFDATFATMESQKLSTRSSIDLRILRTAIAGQLLQIEDMALFERNPMIYILVFDVNVYLKRNFAPLEVRARSIVAIENQVPNLIATAKTNLRDALPKPYVETGIQITAGVVDFLKKDLVLAMKDLKDEKLRAEITDSNNKAIAAFSDYAAWLAKEKLPKAVQDFAIGGEKFQQMLSKTELVDLSPEQVLAIGLKELKHQQDELAAAAKIIDPSKPAPQVFAEIQKDHPTAQNLIPDVAKDLETIRGYLVAHHIITIPSEVRAAVKETPQYSRATSFASMDTPGPFEKKATEAFYYVTPVEPTWTPQQAEEWLTSFNYYTSDVVSIHEAYPGHYVQFLRLNVSGATKAEKIFGSYAFVEGWAHYCEQMVVDDGFGSCDCPTPSVEQKIRVAKYRMAQADEALLRVCRLCASIKMHTQGMSVGDATKFFRENCYYEEKPARSEAMRGTFDPGYMNYTLGKLEFLKLRADFKAQEGSNFSLQKFNDAATDHGMPPVRLLREILLKDKAKWNEVL